MVSKAQMKKKAAATAAPVTETPAETPTTETPVTETPADPVETPTETPTETPVDPVETQAAPVTETGTGEVTPPVVAPEGFDLALSAALESDNLALKSIAKALDSYLSEMKPRVAISSEDGARAQHVLWKSIQAVLESAPADFKPAWGLLVAAFTEHVDGALGARYVFRFSEFWHWSVDELTAFQSILNLLLLTAEPGGRANALKQVQLEKTLALVFTDVARQNVTSFFNP